MDFSKRIVYNAFIAKLKDGRENMTPKEKIIEIYYNNVHGKSPNVSGMNVRHDGRKGQWLEHQFGILSNASNSPDLFGYELKNETSSKTTFGDWSANEYVFTNPAYKSVFNCKKKLDNREKFLHIFGKPNKAKNNRYSWSGEPCPKIGEYNRFGQILRITSDKDIVAEYDYDQDERPDKKTVVPQILRINGLILAKWYGFEKPVGYRGKTLKEKLEDKFNANGWFTCKKDSSGRYCKICFGKPLNFAEWLNLVNAGIVFFDSGMYEGNERPYSQWRANNNLWDSLIVEEYE